MLLVFSLSASLLAVAAARCRAMARESRRAQAVALAESGVAALQAALAAGASPAPVEGTLATGAYSARVTRSGAGEVTLRAVGQPAPLLGEMIVANLEVTLARRGREWQVVAWREART